jgi:uncharacterized cupredoxin-like copper-binding protein
VVTGKSFMKGEAMRSIHCVMVLAGGVGLGIFSTSGEAQQLVKATLLSDAIHLDISQVRAGPVTFDVHNAAENNMVHELVVLKTSLADNALPVRNGQVPEQKFKKMGEVEDVAPGKTKRLTIKLASGHYVVVCNKPGHYSMGMHATLVATP